MAPATRSRDTEEQAAGTPAATVRGSNSKPTRQEEERRAEERRKQQFEQEEQKQMEAENAKRDKLRKKRETTFERIVAEAPPVFTAPAVARHPSRSRESRPLYLR